MDFNGLYLRALKYLNFRPRSEKEMRDFLKEKVKQFSNTDSSVIDLIIHKLKQQRFLNDHEFTQWFVRSRTEFKPKGKYLVKIELKQKGISQDIIEEVLQNIEVRSASDVELATDALLRKKRKYEDMDRQERFNKAGSFLARRGFDLDTIKAAIDSVFGKVV